MHDVTIKCSIGFSLSYLSAFLPHKFSLCNIATVMNCDKNVTHAELTIIVRIFFVSLRLSFYWRKNLLKLFLFHR